MAAGLPDLVDCARLAEDTSTLLRAYELGDMARLTGLLEEASGMVNARFAFAKLESGRSGAEVSVEAELPLVCQRCLRGFRQPVVAASQVQFATTAEADAAEVEQEFFVTDNGLVSLQDLAEEELLLAMPIAPACSDPLTCGYAPKGLTGVRESEDRGEVRRPFGALRDLLKKT